MLSREGTVLLVPNEYQRLVGSKIRELSTKFEEIKRNRKLYEKLILKNESKVIPNPILKGVIANKEIDYYSKTNIYNMFRTTKLLSDSNNVDNINLIVGNDRIDSNRIIVTYYEKFKRYVIMEHGLNDRIKKYKKLNISIFSLRYMFKNMLKFAASYILTTGNWFMLPHYIGLKILGKHRRNAEKKYGVIKSKPDWDESYKTLEAIAKDIQPSILTAYRNKNITRKQFVIDMKPYIYNKEDRPNAPKWIVQSDKELDFWLIITSRFSKLVNVSKYWIVPSNYISPSVVRELGIERKQSEFIKLVKHVDDIISTDYLGFRDKLAMLDKYDKNFCMNTYDIN